MVAAIVVSYHPRENELVNNIRSYAHSVEKILVWRNSSEALHFPEDLQNKVILCGRGVNDYMAVPLNYGVNWCVENEYEYLLTMDQDSTWENADYFISKALSSGEKNVAIFSPNVEGQYSRPAEDYDAESVITSGSLVDVRIAQKLGGFREDYKIYWVDGEFCYWARINGYRIRVFHDCTLLQQFGKQTKTLFGFMTSNYSPQVYYFLIRNMFWMKREFPSGVSLKTVLYTLMYNLRGIILGEKNKFRKIHSINKGIVHGLFCKIKKREKIS